MWSHHAIVRYIRSKERHISALALLVGFISDNLVLPRIDSVAAALLLGVYTAIVGLLIVLLQMIEGKHIVRERIVARAYVLPIAIQFFFGALLSAIFVYYSRSGTVSESWPFLFLLLLVLVGNEVAYKRYSRLWFQLAVYFFVLFMGLSFMLPVVLGKMGAAVFLMSGLLAVLVMTAFASLLALLAPETVRKDKYRVGLLIGGIGVLMNTFYFSNIIPPIPLSLRSAELAHGITHSAGDYILLQEVRPKSLLPKRPTVHLLQGESVYFFSAVFAPVKFDTRIMHEWEFYNPTTKEWETRAVIPFGMTGGREKGYRGYSVKTNVEEGVWRVAVRTANGALLGREQFVVTMVSTPTTTYEKVL